MKGDRLSTGGNDRLFAFGRKPMTEKIILGRVDRLSAMSIAHKLKDSYGMDKLASMLLTSYATCDHALLERFKASCRTVLCNNGEDLSKTLADVERLKLPKVATQLKLF
jgi:hypothetical protein